MKKIDRNLWPIFSSHFLVSILTGFALSGAAQIGPNPSNTVPVVTIWATDPVASASGNPGFFTVRRDGPTNAALNVFYRIGGTASNGVDYASIGNWVNIPAGVRTNVIPIDPINHGQTNLSTVVLKLAPSPMLPPVNYAIGSPDTAVVYIMPVGVSNLPPLVRMVQPPDGAVFYPPAPIPLIADAADLDGVVVSVEFFAGRDSLGVVTNWVVVDPPGPGTGYIPGTRGFLFAWSNAVPGSYLLTAKATDDGGATSVSPPVSITVRSTPPTNLPPLVRITSPANGTVFRAPADVPIYAFARDLDGSVTSVEFFDGTNSLGLGQGLCLTATPPLPICPTNVFVLVWSNAPIGLHVLLAKATDDGGASTVSPPVNIAVLPSPPPPTNRPPIVSVIAADPIAIEGTNCWPWLGLTNRVPTWSNWVIGASTCRWFTNCGPKNATFVVHRFGATNDDLQVDYDIGGSASNGVDYVTLPGSVTIPAGLRQAEITVVPLDDGPPDINSTVVIRLAPTTNYFIGWPRSAAALIIDNGWPRPGSAMLAGNWFNLSTTGPDGAWFHVEYSIDLINWTSICTNQVVGGSINFIDPDSPVDQSRFYRAVPEAGPPPE